MVRMLPGESALLISARFSHPHSPCLHGSGEGHRPLERPARSLLNWAGFGWPGMWRAVLAVWLAGTSVALWEWLLWCSPGGWSVVALLDQADEVATLRGGRKRRHWRRSTLWTFADRWSCSKTAYYAHFNGATWSRVAAPSGP